MNIQTEKKGFTIIEVVLVLAIAALIFLMVFVALPALQRGQRDTARKQDVGKVVSAVNSYKSNNRGSISGAAELTTARLSTYVKDELAQVLTAQVVGGTGNPAEDTIDVTISAKCGVDGAVDMSGTDRQAAVRTTLESEVVYCETA